MRPVRAIDYARNLLPLLKLPPHLPNLPQTRRSRRTPTLLARRNCRPKLLAKGMRLCGQLVRVLEIHQFNHRGGHCTQMIYDLRHEIFLDALGLNRLLLCNPSYDFNDAKMARLRPVFPEVRDPNYRQSRSPGANVTPRTVTNGMRRYLDCGR
jgi:hypothetical protein